MPRTPRTPPTGTHRRRRSRRDQPRPYLIDRPPRLTAPPRRPDPDDPAVQAARLLALAGSTVSALRRPLREAGIGPRLARLVLLFTADGRPLRAADVAWRLGVTTAAASKLLDEAEERALVDKHYWCIDRRGTWVKLTSRGRDLRATVETALRGLASTERPRGVAFGIRWYLEVSDHL